jgi:hypothetical protein
MAVDIHGLFAHVCHAFERNFEEHGDVGASFALTQEGEYLIDLTQSAGYLQTVYPIPTPDCCSSTIRYVKP